MTNKILFRMIAYYNKRLFLADILFLLSVIYILIKINHFPF